MMPDGVGGDLGGVGKDVLLKYMVLDVVPEDVATHRSGRDACWVTPRIPNGSQ